jgi:hypothetical protein
MGVEVAVGIDKRWRVEGGEGQGWSLIPVMSGACCRPEAVPPPIRGEVPVSRHDHRNWAALQDGLQDISDEVLLATRIARGKVSTN